MQASPAVFPPGSVRMRPMLDALARNWGLILLRGILAIIFGILTFIWPGITLLTLVLLYGAFAFADGILSIVAAIRGGAPAPRWWLALVGIFGIAAGVLTLLWPQITGLVLLYFIAGWAIASGIFEIVGAIKLRKEIDDEWLLIASGVLAVAFGCMLIAWPGAGALALVLVIGSFAIFYGILLVAFAMRLRKHAEVKI
ncbi:HdeD family acid-resistance protein [Hyphomicrobium sp.]|uniref:HdeD family acid-resistance protein n=1 Tax=Hyphomicrobium sp. TaxID=82 RepID=UPI002E31C577|nr:HdeD family acid-resistance protein [Hyphomicrobium sp.]HEX2842878.1 HdeD family acid-resistance protein [Hyphomicrobium sp.]